MHVINPSMRRICGWGALAALPIVLLAGCGGGGGGGDSSGQSGPAITSISPATGAGSGGTVVTITGSNFGSSSGGLTVKFGSANAASFTYVSSTTITAVAPPGAGKVDVAVTNVFGTSPATAGDQFTYTTDGPPPPPPI